MVDEFALIDILVGTAVGVGIIVGLVRGFVLQVAGIGGLVGGLLLADLYHARLGTTLHRLFGIGQPGTVAFIAIVVTTVLVVTAICALLRKGLGSLRMGSYDRLLGGVFGLLKACLLCAGILLALVALAPEGGTVRGSIRSSRSGPLLWELVDRMSVVLPEKSRDQVQGFLRANEVRPEPEEGATPESGETPDDPAG
ncbi:MAG: CvpA family protein [Planctomycetota bacterium]